MYATLTNMQAIEYRQLFRWYIDLSEVFDVLSDFIKVDRDVGKETNQIVCFLCESIGLPEKDIESVTANIQGIQVEIGCFPLVKGTKDFTFLDTVSGKVLHALLLWQLLAGDTSRSSIKDDEYLSSKPPITSGLGGYKFDIPTYVLDSQKNIVLKCIFVGAWAKTVNPGGDLSSDSSELAKPIVTISYDGSFYLKG